MTTAAYWLTFALAAACFAAAYLMDKWERRLDTEDREAYTRPYDWAVEELWWEES